MKNVRGPAHLEHDRRDAGHGSGVIPQDQAERDGHAQTADLRRLRTLADWMDRKFVDPILGLVLPGVGDGLGAAFGFYTVFVAWRMGVHPVTLARMLTNLGIDALLGSIPVLGWVADFFYRAHLRNLELLERRLPQSAQRDRAAHRQPSTTTLAARPSDYVVLTVAIAFFLSALLLPVLFTGWLIYWLFGQVGQAWG